MDMEVKTALDKFYECFENPEKADVFFDYDGLRYQLSCCGYIFTERTEDCEDEQEYGFDEIALENDVAEIEETPTGKYMVTMGYKCSDAYEDIYVEVTVWYDNEGFTTDSIVATVILLGYYDNSYETYTQEQICYDENMEMVYGATLEDDVCTFAATNSGYSCVDNTYYDDNYEIITKEDFDAEVDRVLQPIDEILYGY